jgi:hypothetical protein
VDRYGDRHLAVGRRRQLKKRTLGDSGFWQKLAAARGQLTRRAIAAPRKDTAVRDQARTMLYDGPLKAERPERDVGCSRNATKA